MFLLINCFSYMICGGNTMTTITMFMPPTNQPIYWTSPILSSSTRSNCRSPTAARLQLIDPLRPVIPQLEAMIPVHLQCFFSSCGSTLPLHLHTGNPKKPFAPTYPPNLIIHQHSRLEVAQLSTSSQLATIVDFPGATVLRSSSVMKEIPTQTHTPLRPTT